MELIDVIERMKVEQAYAKSVGVDVDLPLMYRVYYDQDKKRTGSFKPLMGKDSIEYEGAMNGRYDRIFSKIRSTIDAKFSFNKDC